MNRRQRWAVGLHMLLTKALAREPWYRREFDAETRKSFDPLTAEAGTVLSLRTLFLVKPLPLPSSTAQLTTRLISSDVEEDERNLPPRVVSVAAQVNLLNPAECPARERPAEPRACCHDTRHRQNIVCSAAASRRDRTHRHSPSANDMKLPGFGG